MKRTSQNRSRRRKEAGQFLPAIGLAAACLLSFVLAEIPAWWNDRGLVKKNPVNLQPVAASDFAAANQGQLKNVAIATYEEFLARMAELGGIGADIAPVPGNASDKGSPGWRLRELVSRWVRIDRATGRILRAVLDAQSHPTGIFSLAGTGPRQPAPGASAAKDFAAITQGQLKAVAAPFYDRLAEVFWSYNGGTSSTSQIDPAWAKPWTDTPDDDNNHAMASLGQLKRTFSLDLHSDADADGLTNLAELLANKQRSSSDHLRWTDLSNAYTTGGQLTDGEQVALGLDPTVAANAAPPAAPTGLHIIFPDAVAHGADPDISQIRVEWNPPPAGVGVSFHKTYAGDPGGWGNPVQLSSNAQSPIFTGLPSKRIHEYRITFTGLNSLSASSVIAYEVPVIRALMHRKVATGLNFLGVLMYPALPFAVVPRKFRGLTHTWNFDSTSVTHYINAPTVTETQHQDGSYARHMYLYTHSHSISGTAHDNQGFTGLSGGDYQWHQDRSYSFDLAEPSAMNPSGPVSLDSTDTVNDTSGEVHSWEEHLQLGIGLQSFQVADTNGNPSAPLPFSSFSGTDWGRYFDGDPSSGDKDDFSWSASPTLVNDTNGQRLDWSGYYDWTITNGGMTSTTHEPQNYGNVSYALGFASVAAGDFDPGRTGVVTATTGPWNFPLHGENPPPGVTPHIAFGTDGLNWTRSYTYSDSGPTSSGSFTYTETWTETVTVSDEISSPDLADAAVATYAPLSTIGWAIPGQQPPSRFSNGFSVGTVGLYDGLYQFSNSWLNWNYTNSYSGITSAQLAATSAPGQSYVTIQPQFAATVGKYSLYDAEETRGVLVSSEYKFRFYPPAEDCTISWLEKFTPDHSEADQTPQYKPKTYTVLPGHTEMPDSARIVVDRTEGWSTVTAVAPRGIVVVGPLRVELVPDYTQNEAIDEDDKGKVTDKDPWRFWINDDADNHASADGESQPAPSPGHTTPYVNGSEDLKDFFPLFLDIQQLVKAFPPRPDESVTYTLSQEDDALNFVETDLTAEEAFSYRDDLRPYGYGSNLAEAASSATKQRVTAAGVKLSGQFLNNIRYQNRGVILCEGRAPTNKPLLCRMKRVGKEDVVVSLPLDIGPRILLLLHGMNSSTATWDDFVRHKFGSNIKQWATDIHVEKHVIPDGAPTKLKNGVRCYRLQFGAKETDTLVREGLDGLTLQNAPHYLDDRNIQCGDFETFAELGAEVDEAIKLLIQKYRNEKYPDGNIQVVLLGHSRGGIAARQFLQAGSDASQKVVIGMLTTGTPHLGGRLGRIYQWLKAHPRPPAGTRDADWKVVDRLMGAIDVRRPVIGDVADNSDAIADLNMPAKVKNMPPNIRYGEIIYEKTNLGVLKLIPLIRTSLYSVFDGLPILPPAVDPGPSLSAAASKFILGAGFKPKNYRGDGLIVGANQCFTDLPNFDGKKIKLRRNTTDTVVHTDEPSRFKELDPQLNALMPAWFP